MLTEAQFIDRTAALAEANEISLDLAGRYMSLIGDTPELAGDGKLLVRDENDVELVRLTAPADWDLTSPA